MVPLRIAGVVFLLGVSPVLAEGMPHVCKPMDEAFKHVTDHGGIVGEVTNDQRIFLEGIYSMAPTTPTGLPLGDRAFMGQREGSDMSVIFWIDGGLACDAMTVPKEIVDMLSDIAAKVITHEGASN